MAKIRGLGVGAQGKFVLFTLILFSVNTVGHKTELCLNVPKAIADAKVNNEFTGYVTIFNHPERFMGPEGNLSKKQIDELAKKARDFLIEYAHKNPGNDVHIAEHLESLEKIKKSLTEAGGDAAVAELIILIHDLGKEYNFLPERYRKKMDEIFTPENLVEVLSNDKNSSEENKRAIQFSFLGKNIMGHEFGSMFMITDMVEGMNLTPAQKNKLMALIARHNAGYDPKLEGKHFFVSPFTWGKYAKMMKEKGGVEISPEYFEMVHADKGGDINTIVVTAHDRALTMTLNSLKKIPQRLINEGNWNSEALATLFREVSSETMKEVKSVTSKLHGLETPPDKLAARKVLEADILAQHEPNAKKIDGIAGQFLNIREESEKRNAVYYRTKKGEVIKVTVDKTSPSVEGTLYVRRANGEFEESSKGHPLNLLFDKYIFPENNYTPPQLKIGISPAPERK